MKVELPEIRPEERTPLVEALLEIIRHLADRVAALEATIQEVRDENATLKGQKPRPPIRPSLLNSPGQVKDGTGKGRRRGKPTRPRNVQLTIHHTVPLYATALPEGATLRGFEPYVVQELNITSVNTKYLRAR